MREMSFMNKKVLPKCRCSTGFNDVFPKMDPRNIEIDKNAVMD